MEQSKPECSSSAMRAMRKRTRSQRKGKEQHESRREDRKQWTSIEETVGGCEGLSLASPNSSLACAESYTAIVPCASQQQYSQYNRRRNMLSFVAAAAVLICYPSIFSPASASASPSTQHYTRVPPAFFVPPISRHSPNINPLMSIQRMSPQQRRNKRNLDTTWSNAVREKSELNESRFGVRKRVKSVLKKAKKRTGVENSSTGADKQQTKTIYYGESSFRQTGLNIVAETASIGGLGEVVIDEEGSVEVALDFVRKGDKRPVKGDNGTAIEIMELPSSGQKYEDPAILNKMVGEVATKVNGVKVSSTASTNYVLPRKPVDFQRPEDDFVLRKRDNLKIINETARKQYVEKEAFTGDVSAAFSLPREPLPFELPTLDTEQYRRLMDGERVQYQDDMGRAGSGFVVWDVKAPASVVWDCLLDFKSYPQTIPTCREVVMYTNTHLKEDYRAEKPLDYEDGTVAIVKHGVPSVTRAQFSLSKFRLKIAAVHKYRPHPKGDYMIFTLDPASRNMVLKYAKGIWYTQRNPDGKEGYTRVWLLCELRVSRFLPQWIVDYAAARAMPRATTWLKPQVETAAILWLKDTVER